MARLTGHDQEAGGVVLGVLDVGLQDLEAVDLGGEPRGDGAAGRVAGGAMSAAAPGGVRDHAGAIAVPAQEVAALADGVDVALDLLDRLETGAGHAEQLVVHAHELLADDVQTATRQQVVHVGDPAGDRVVDRDHGVARLPVAHGRERVLERVAGQRDHLGIGLPAGEMRVGSRHALEGDGVVRDRRRAKARRSCAGLQDAARLLEIGRRVDAERDRVDEAHADAHAVLQRPQLLQALALLERARRQGGEPFECRRG